MSCIMYISHLWIFFGALVSSNAQYHRNTRCTEVTVNASLKSEVFLPCHFNISHHNETESVNWNRYSSLVTIRINGRIFFHSLSEGRVNVFPLLSKHGNFSILIHDLQSSDIGTYTCRLNSECWTVKINERPHRINESNPWFYFAAGAGLLILLFIAFSLLSKFYGKCVNTSSKPDPVNGVQSEGSNSLEETQNTESSGHRNKRGVRRGPTTVYENDIHAPNQSSAVQQGQHPQRAFRAAPEPTTSHPSDVKPYYVNQAELSIPANAGKKRKKQKHFQFKNPIYSD
ncbi:uncharacterized protein LOC107701404 [Sinocyclocheilus anshuiensis]|uniref:uncharacterized protein LOC107701404 n=1 Tax=Sinocyclocheilus anshuiensis TaxID=1608454 RepID=UPI0007BADBDF|nr:PREDICTED: uncharacterized protein LOC107701404 [Sinocyclocheilus anshuiensis]